MNKEVEDFFKHSKNWHREMDLLRSIVLKTKLEETFKWSLPCYTHGDKNVVIIQPFKSCLALMFFKGSLLKDTQKILSQIGPNSKVGRRFEFKNAEEISALAPSIRAYIKEAIALEDSGLKPSKKRATLVLPDELEALFAAQPKVKAAFQALTPGRQRAYVIYFSGAKQSATRLGRIKKCVPKILKGLGFNDH